MHDLTVDVQRRLLVALLLGEVDRVLVGLVRRDADLGVDAPVVEARAVAIAAVLVGIERSAGVVARGAGAGRREVARQVEMILVDDRAADLRVVALLARAAEGVGVPLTHRAEVAVEHGAGAAFEFDLLGRLAGNEVDGAAHAAGAVEHRDVALLHLDLREVRRQEAIEVEAVVVGKVDAHAVHVERHAEAVETAHEDVALVAAAARVLHRHAGKDAHRLIERVLVEGPHRLVGDGGAADQVELAERVDADAGAAFAGGLTLGGSRRDRRRTGADGGLLLGGLAGDGLGGGFDDHRRQRRRLFGRHIAARCHGSGILRCRWRGHSKAHRGATQRRVRKLGHGNTPRYAKLRSLYPIRYSAQQNSPLRA